MNASQRRRFKIHAQNYTKINQVLYRRNHDSILLRCVPTTQITKLIDEFHSGVFEGHYFEYTIVGKIIQAGYYWPTMFKDAFAKAQNYEKCQRYVGRKRNAALPLELIQVEEPFQQWGIDFIRAINPNSSSEHKFILTATDFFTKWVKAEAVKEANQKTVLRFMEKLITRYGIPQMIISDNGLAFVGAKVTDFAMRLGIYWKTSSNYYPQGNGLAESINKNLIWILKRTVEDNP